MDFTFIGEGIDAVVIDNVYTEDQVASIWKELTYITDRSKLQPPDKTGSAATDGVLLKNNKALFLDEMYKDYKFSPIISNGLEKFRSKELNDKLIEHNPMYKCFRHLNGFSTLVSYYEDSDYYAPHKDFSVFTVLTYFFKEPKHFEGGQITLFSENHEKKAEIEIMNNRSIIILSCTDHEVSEIRMKDKFTAYGGDGRYCISHFCSAIDPREMK